MNRLLTPGFALALVMLLTLSTACAQPTVSDKGAQQVSPPSQTPLASSGGEAEQGGWYCPWCGSQTGGYTGYGMGYRGYGMGPGMMGGYQMGPGMMGGMMGGGYAGSPGRSQSSSRENRGMAIYEANCSSCHPRGGNTIYPNLPVRGAPQLVNFETFLAFLRNPTMPNGARGPMPPFPASTISNQQAHELYRYIVGTEQSGPARQGDKPLSQEQVKKLVENYIHNTRNPNLKLGKITKEPGKDYYIATITTHDGSLVDKIEINPYTGWFRSAYGR